ncbi:MAG: catechol 1,2-dioxygenase [Actinomycetota bacterium]|jgi:catechol 1,2-dioxygenase|nr:catechol 1,2-dioxygenase [Actinomycetota bacterium]
MGNRADQVIGDVLKRIHEAIVDNDVTYDEYQAVKQWLIDVGEAGEWPLFLDVFVESAVEQQVYRDREGSQGTILGPYHLPDAPVLDAPYELPKRDDEQGDRMHFSGRVVDHEGNPLAGAVLDVWHADAKGLYSGFDPSVPEGILRGKVIADDEGRYEVRSIVPAPYTIPHDGPTGKMIAAADWHPWRPAHIHLIVSADGYEALTTQLYIDSSDYLDDDVASAVKDNLVVHLEPKEGEPEVLHFDYDFALAPARTPAVA